MTLDGAYYALKGYIYQFDSSILVILENTKSVVWIEYTQDIAFEQYVIQVKHRESKKFSLSLIRTAIIQLLEEFIRNPDKTYWLRCYFPDKPEELWRPHISQLNQILGSDGNRFSVDHKAEFLRHFVVAFSVNFDAQFNRLLDKLQESFSLRTKDEAILYHSIIRANLFQIALKEKQRRQISFDIVKRIVKDSEVVIFNSSYRHHLTRERYESAVRKRYFAERSPNSDKFKRLFVIDCVKEKDHSNLVRLANLLGRKYYKKNKSPAPYISFVNAPVDLVNAMKTQLVSDGFRFCDGTFFHGDEFHSDLLVKDEVSEVKFIQFDYIDSLGVSFATKYYFLGEDALRGDDDRYIHATRLEIEDVDQVIRIVER